MRHLEEVKLVDKKDERVGTFSGGMKVSSSHYTFSSYYELLLLIIICYLFIYYLFIYLFISLFVIVLFLFMLVIAPSLIVSVVCQSPLLPSAILKLSSWMNLLPVPSPFSFEYSFIGLDPGNKIHLWSIIQKLKENRLVFLTTHSMEEADYLSDKIVMLGAGRFVS
jgi:hypothetical protein